MTNKLDNLDIEDTDLDLTLPAGDEYVLLWYDGPLLCILVDQVGQRYLATCIDHNDDGDFVYLAVRVSHRRLAAIHANATTMFEAFRFPEDGHRFVVDGLTNGKTGYLMPGPVMRFMPAPGTRLNMRPGKYEDRRRRRLTRRERERKAIRIARGIVSTTARSLRHQGLNGRQGEFHRNRLRAALEKGATVRPITAADRRNRFWGVVGDEAHMVEWHPRRRVYVPVHEKNAPALRITALLDETTVRKGDA